MKTLYLLRHAKSDWSNMGAADFDRPLNRRGRKDVPRLAALLQKLEAPPGLVISSSATRARSTAEGIVELLPTPPPLRLEERLYLADPNTLAAVVCEVDAAFDAVLTVAHNPGMEQWIEALCGAVVRLPTAGLACLHCAIGDWAQLPDSEAQLQWFIPPKLLKVLAE